MCKNTIKLSAITLAFLGYSSVTFAEVAQDTTELEKITVSSQQDDISVKDKKVGETIKTSSQLKRQQVQDSRDLVRYETGVTVVEAGRFGSSGYAIRGVDENRVAITVDGLAQAEALSSEGFRSLFEGYGNFNNTRNGVEIETLKQVQINKGANSLKSGSGALGGSVIFETKDARDYLIDKNWYASYKKGYNTADNQYSDTFTLAGRHKWFDALIVRTERNGKEVENFGYETFDATVQGRLREKADPYDKRLESTLMKFAFQPNENHRFTVMADLYNTRSKGADLSYTLKSTHLTKFGDSLDELEYRHNNDQVNRTNYAFSYENYSSNVLWDTLKLTYSEQKIRTRARNEDYCDGNDKCSNVKNPLGLKYNENNELVGEDGKPISYTKKRETRYEYIKESEYNSWKNDNKLPENIAKHGLTNDTISPPFYCYHEDGANKSDCKITFSINTETLFANGVTYDLNKQHLIRKVSTVSPNILSCEGINCNSEKKTIKVFKNDGTPIDLAFKVENGMAVLNSGGGSTYYAPNLILPASIGYNQNLWTDRSLNTNTKQLNLDLTKYLELGKTQNNFSYGALLSKTKKEMVNQSGDSADNVKWWAIHPADCIKSHNSLCNKSNIFSFLVPVKTTNSSLYFANELKLNNYLSFDLGYRYDRIKYKPSYIAGVTPKIPDDMVDGLAKNFVDPFKEKEVPEIGAKPNWWDDKYKNRNDPQIAIDLAEWNKKNEERNAIIDENKRVPEKNKLARHQANIDTFIKNKKYSANSYSFGINVDPTDYLRLQFKHSKGFRAPTADEIYFTFKFGTALRIFPNIDLKEETAKTEQVALTLYKDFGFVTLNYFETKYDNFIDLARFSKHRANANGGGLEDIVYQNVNRDYAKVKGIEVSSRLNLGVLSNLLNEIDLSYKLTYQKGKIQVTEDLEGVGDEVVNVKVPMNPIQPLTSVYGLSYNHNSGKFGLDLYVTHVAAKKAKDTYNDLWRVQKSDEEAQNPSNIGNTNVTKDNTVRWRSNAYTLVDLVAYAKPLKNVTLQFGVYNLTNKKYMTWDSARSIRHFGTSNRIHYVTGQGINRFNAPGRNYKLSAEITF